jgi:uncharacterized protein (UPF0548 family)
VSTPLTGPPAGSTRPAEAGWDPPPGWRGYQRTVVTGSGAAHWAVVSAEVLEWGVKTRSGFAVEPAAGQGRRVTVGAEPQLVVPVGPFTVREPVRVVDVVTAPDRCGFAYGTLPGHPVSGEEAFVVHRAPDGTVSLTLRSLTRSAPGPWRPVFPALLVAQRWYRRRYLRVLRGL